VTTVPAHAFLGFGDIVFDPTLYAEAIRNIIQLEQQYEQMVATYNQVRGQYEHLKMMARQVPVNMEHRYRSYSATLKGLSVDDTYGNARGWVSALNGDGPVRTGYGQTTTSLEDYGTAFNNIPADQRTNVKASVANVELTDGVNIRGMEAIGMIHANSEDVERTISALEQDSLSSDPAMNTEIAVLNKVNAASLVAIRNAQDTNNLLLTIAEQQILQAKRMRDAEARAINTDVRFRTEAKAVLDSQSANASAAMLAWRMP
jgi:hypothetical protein